MNSEAKVARGSRQILLYAMHGRVNGDPVDYRGFFRWLASLSPRDRLVNVGSDLAIGLEEAQESGGLYRMRFNAGDPTGIAMFTDPETGVSELRNDQRGYPSSATRVTVDPDQQVRLVSIEYRRNGVTAGNLSRYFVTLAERQGYGAHLSFDLNPLPAESFEREIERFARIREASIVVTRPNFDWSDDSSRLAELADESGGQKVDASVRAGRGASLHKDRGIVAQIKTIARLGRPSNVANARVRGVMPGEQTESTVSLDRHQVKQRVPIDTVASPAAQDEAVWDAQDRMITENRSRAYDLADDPETT